MGTHDEFARLPILLSSVRKNIEEKRVELPIRNWVLWQRTGFLLVFELDMV